MSDDYRYPHSLVSLPVLPLSSVEIAEAEPSLKSLSASEMPPGESAITASAPPPFLEKTLLRGKVIEALQEIYDPEIPVNIFELGLIYDIKIDDDNTVHLKMTLTAPACPVAGSLPGEVEKKVEAIPEVKSADVELVWEPPWTRDLMSEAALLTLGML